MTTARDIDWAELEDAYGPAVDVPDQLGRVAAGGAHWEQALGDLRAGVFHQGGCYSATPVAVRFLIEMLASDTTPRAAVLVFLAELSMAHVDDATPGFDPWAFRSGPPGADYPEGAATVAAVTRGAAAYVELLRDELPEVRAAAAYLCAGVAASHEAAAPLLGILLRTDPEPAVRASAALCCSRVGDAARLAPSLDDPCLLVRAAAAIGRAWGGAVGSQVVSVLVEAALASPGDVALMSPSFPWGEDGGLVGLAVAALAGVGARRELRGVLRSRLARGERPIEHAPPSPEAAAWSPEEVYADEALRALAAALAPLEFPGLHDRERPALLSELNSDQSALIAEAAAAGLPLPIRAVPWFTARAMQRFLADTQGELERQVTVEHGEPDCIWRHLYRIAPHTTSQAEVDAVLSAINRESDAHAVLALCVDMLSGAYSHFAGTELCLPFHKWEPLRARLDAEAQAIEPALLQLASEPVGSDSRRAQLLARPLVALARQRGCELPGSLDAVLQGALYSQDKAWVRGLLEWLPIERRSGLLGGISHAHTIRQHADLCDMALLQRGALHQLTTWEHHPERARQLLVQLFDAAQLRSEIDTRKNDERSGASDRVVALLSAALESLLPVHQLTVARAEARLYCRLVSPGGSELRRASLPATPKLEDLRTLLGGDLPQAVDVQLDFDDHTLGYRLQRLLSEAGVVTVHFGGSSVLRRSSA